MRKLLFLFLFFTGLVIDVSGATRYVTSGSKCAGNSQTYYSSIQAGINAASNGDTVSICDGSYTENNIQISKNNLAVQGYSGNRNNVSISKNNNSIFIIQASNATIKDLSIVSSGTSDYGITDNWQGSGSHTFDNLSISTKTDSIYLGQNSLNNTFKNLKISSSTGKGIALAYNASGNHTFSNVSVTSYDNGIDVARSGTLNISDVNITSANGSGIVAAFGITLLENFNITAKTYGVNAVFGQDMTIRQGIITATTNNGINLSWGGANAFSLKDTVISSGGIGVYIPVASSATIDHVCITAATNGISAEWNAHNVTIKNSKFTNNTLTAVSIASDPAYKATVTNNCFKTLPFAYRNNTAHTFNGNYWNGTVPSGYDNAPLATCPINACYAAIPKPNVEYQLDECLWKGTIGEVIDSGTNNTGATPKSANGSLIPQTSAQIINNGALFSRISQQYVELPTLAQNAPNFNDGFTATAWAKFSGSAGSWERIFDIGNGTNINNIFLGRQGVTNNLVMGIHDPGTNQYIIANAAISDTNWHFWGATCDGSGRCKLYKDGVKIAESTTMKIPLNVTRTKNYIGKSNWSADAYLEGGVDEFKFFDSTLSDSDIATIYDNEKVGKNYDGTTRSLPICTPALSTCWSEAFSSTDLSSNWTIIKAQSYTPQVVNGKLMLTDNSTGIATGITLNGNMPADNNYIQIEFEHNAYGGSRGADGIALVLSDASINASRGANGGSLGYAQKTTTNGFSGGWLGIGLDEYGNFSNATEGRSGGIGYYPDAVAIRGTGSGLTGYTYIAGSGTLTPGIDNLASTSPAPGYKYKLSVDTRNSTTWVKVERDTTGTGSSYSTIVDWTNAAQAATAPANFQLSLTGSTGSYTNYHSVDNFVLNAQSCGTIGITIIKTAYNFDAWDTFRSISDRNISTKIVNKPFNLTVASLKPTNNALQDFNGTVCAQLINTANNTQLARQCHAWSNQQSDSTFSFTVTRAVKDAKVKLSWKKNDASGSFTDGSENNSTIASDHFAIRPASFALSAPNAKAGVNFDITLSAPIYGTSTGAIDYNETSGGSFTINVTEDKTGCILGSFNPALSIFSFANGSKVFTTRYSEVGVLDVNISDVSTPCTSRFAAVDCDDKNVAGYYSALSDLPIGSTPAQITVIPDHFDVNATLTNFAGGSFTYLSTDLNMSAKLDLNITAKNGENNTTKNYTSGCYSKDTTLTLAHSSVPSPLSKILYSEALSAVNTNVLNGDSWALTFGSTLFTSGSISPNIDFNFDRSPSKPLNPFNFDFTSAVADDTTTTGTGVPLGTATLAYGRARVYDIATNTSPVDVPVEFEVYSSNPTNPFVSGTHTKPQTTLKWYRNLDHNNAAEGTVIQGGFHAGANDTAITISSAPHNGLQIVNITSTADQTIHLDIDPWLWYSPKSIYSYSGDCKQHPCFNYDFTDSSAGIKGVSSGTFQGGDFEMAPAKNITKKGVKLFR